MEKYHPFQLRNKIDTSDEHEVDIPSNDLFRPLRKQIGNSLHEIKDYFASEDGLTVVPSCLPPSLIEVKSRIKELIIQNNGFRNYDYLIKRHRVTSTTQREETKGFMFLANSFSVAFDFCTHQSCPDDVICDVFTLVPHQPALVLTIANSNDDITRYNTSVARGVCTSLGRFMGEGFKTAHGVVTYSDLTDSSRLKTRVEEILKGSGRFVTYRSLCMNVGKYDKILTAFWASISQTRSVSSSERDGILRFLTKEQCVVLMENINKTKVEIRSRPGTGSTVLMAEVSKRLSNRGRTVFVCEKQEDRDVYRRIHPRVKIYSIDDIEKTGETDLQNYMCVVDETPERTNRPLSHRPKNGVLWVHYPLTDPADTEEGSSSICQTHHTENEELIPPCKRTREAEHRSVVFTINADGKQIDVICSHREFDMDRVNTKHCHISHNELINSPAGKQGINRYKRYWGTSSSSPISVPSTTQSRPEYWELHAEIEPKDTLETCTDVTASKADKTWGPLFEFGVVEVSHVDKRVWMSQDKRFWCLSVEGCKLHFGSYCTHIRNESSKDTDISCFTEHIAKTNTTSLKYGIIVDVSRDMVAFIDVDKDIVLEAVITDFREHLLPMFAVKNIPKNDLNIKLKLVSGNMINLTDRKKNLIGQSFKFHVKNKDKFSESLL